MTARYVASRTPELGPDAFGVRDRRSGVVRLPGLDLDTAKALARGWNRALGTPSRVRVGAGLFAFVMFVLAVWLLLGIAAEFMSEPVQIQRAPGPP